SAGFDLFQGYFLARPKQVTGNSIRPGTAVTIRLISALDQPRITMDQIAELVSQDPKLAMQMLKIINSPLFNLPKEVEDLKSALVFLGVDLLRQWAMMIAFLSNGNTHVEASRYVLQRAKTMELLAKRNPEIAELAPKAFLAGLVSGVDVLLNIKPSVFLEQVKLSPQIGNAVMQRQAPLGPVLQTVIELESAIAMGDAVLVHQPALHLDLYSEADHWVNQVFDALKAVS
ncbi:MAG: HDOD domain-containing protein, partial [Oleiphilaceae bacterium]|nr:HDOD domain-containing protein [Oleiphilaceae bacterium]